MEEVGGEEELVSASDGLEEEWHGLMERVALRLEEQLVELFVFVARELELDDLCSI